MDYDLWRATFGSRTRLAADGNGDGRVDAADYVVWRNAVGPAGPAATNAVPEPGTIVVAVLTMLAAPLVARPFRFSRDPTGRRLP
jgi:hypothetical protein